MCQKSGGGSLGTSHGETDMRRRPEQVADSHAAVPAIAEDPKGHLCGYPEHTVCP